MGRSVHSFGVRYRYTPGFLFSTLYSVPVYVTGLFPPSFESSTHDKLYTV